MVLWFQDIIIIDGEADKCRAFKTLLGDDGKDFQENVTINPSEDVSTLPYSSGTTGLPKGVMLTHSNIVANVQQLIEYDILFCIVFRMPWLMSYLSRLQYKTQCLRKSKSKQLCISFFTMSI